MNLYYPLSARRSTEISQSDVDHFKHVGAVADAVAITLARRAIRFHRERAARLTGLERIRAVGEANTIARRAGLVYWEGELSAV